MSHGVNAFPNFYKLRIHMHERLYNTWISNEIRSSLFHVLHMYMDKRWYIRTYIVIWVNLCKTSITRYCSTLHVMQVAKMQFHISIMSIKVQWSKCWIRILRDINVVISSLLLFLINQNSLMVSKFNNWTSLRPCLPNGNSQDSQALNF